MTDMVMRVAEALAKRNSSSHPEAFIGIARTAIEAMRDPTDEMLDAGQTPGWSRWEVRGRFNLMIDAALYGHGGPVG